MYFYNTGFTGLVSNKGNFPLVYQKGFQIKPGHNNVISLTATVTLASEQLRSLAPWRRNCIFEDETQNLTIHKVDITNNFFFK
jgi:hypothetical protein